MKNEPNDNQNSSNESSHSASFIRKSIIVGVSVLAIFALANSAAEQTRNNEDIAYYPINQVANVVSAFDTANNPLGGVIPGCIGSVNNSSNSDNCVVTNCDGATYVGNDSLSESDVFGCIEEEYWDGFSGSYTQEEMGCLASQCLNHGTDPLSSFSNSVLPTKADTDEQLDGVPDCIENVNPNSGWTCTVTTCGGGTVDGDNPLSDNQVTSCMGDEPIENATEAQLGCLANECLNHTSVSEVPMSALESLQPGQSNPTIYVVEIELKEKGFFILAPDTVYGYSTIEAIKMFQRSVGLPMTGMLDKVTLERLLK